MEVIVLQRKDGWVCGVFREMSDVANYLKTLHGRGVLVDMGSDEDRTKFNWCGVSYLISRHPL